MKGARSNRVASTEPPDEWVNGSWTVDCICGVTFDDGEEMVNCDECGVWVHTRCSRYVKGDKSFACDKCKSKRRRRLTAITDAEETEVAQLLVELPTKSIHPPLIKLIPSTPLVDRVHVHGVPGGGDSSLFPLLITPQLWKCSGYIPKHFNFPYTDFPNSIDTFNPFSCTAVNPATTATTTTLGPVVENPQTNATTDGEDLKSVTADKPALDHASQLHKSATATLNSSPSPHRDVTVGTLIKQEGIVLAVDEIQAVHSGIPPLTTDMPNSNLLIEGLTNAASKRKNIEILRNLEAVIPLGTDHCSNETKSEAHFDSPKGDLASDPAGIDIESESIKSLSEHVLSPDQECTGFKLRAAVSITSKPLDQDWKDIDNGLEAVAGCQFDRDGEMTDIQCSEKLECEGSDSSMEVQKFLHDSKEAARVAGQMPQLSGAIPPPPTSHQKVGSVGKTSSTSPAIVFSRSYLSDKSRIGGSQNPSLVGKRLMSSSCVNSKKEYVPADLVKNEDKHDKPMSALKDNPKPCFTSTLKPSQPSRTVLKYYASVGKDSLRHSSSKVSSVDSSSVSPSVGEPAGTIQSEHTLHGQNKNIASGGQQRGEKVPQSNLQPSSKSNQSSTGHPTASSNSPAGLSDEELALLLHQELNSSPRVPRVPRVRHAGSLPQLPSTTAANMLMKRTSTSGGKDKNTFSRRKSRDALKDGSRSNRDQDSEARKVDRMPSPDSLQKSDAFTLAEVNTDSKAKKNHEKISSFAANSGPFSTVAVELKSSSARVDSPEDEAGANKNSDPTYRTLPGLIAEIMGTGRRMTYEELCNAVLPHWPNLRKHNGERYAYSSHSQAVLDCLRNRTEWARLVDRGPKTSSSRKKRKIDAEPLSSESEDGEDRNPKDGEDKSFESNKEEFPKGRRKARKRRRAAPQERSVKDGQKRRKVEVGSSCDSGSFSNSSEDSVSSQDDSTGSEMDVANTEVSASSQDVRAM